ncbi:hypothetical protein COY93_00775 [Candidatus Uhrbacteria bacterium CG_4_10_14_0_8_um_filter_58_22]|uniref:Uncharacterized protein n=1 Tax=Candidatus Uhrbacteria bacterium CG_4_10_14_0_8_um_filter_58_22 TaxID=1975029 RepID=A0A2M7QAZ1_9BACT|nr:MAG: hypothetical protein AUJ19_00730 [Parcubacteria group bacterium CG1_02_58_44]PIY63319.1 MAG: hypothetical protein COY93_00775 [Candidatus Uhrbacteria bacterium CG_4_10_14_0_8_um_filter_58_22]
MRGKDSKGRRAEELAIVRMVALHTRPDIEAGLIYVILTALLALSKSRFRFELDRTGRVPVRFISSGPLRAEDWPEIKSGELTPERVLREAKALSVDCGDGPLDQHVVNGDVSSIRLVLDHLGWSENGEFGFLEPLVDLIDRHDRTAEDVTAVAERVEARENGTVSRTLRSYVQTTSRHGSDETALALMDVAFRAIILELGQRFEDEQPADQKVVRCLLSRSGLLDVVARRCPDQQVVEWFGKMMTWAEQRMLEDWADSQAQVWDNKLTELHVVPVPEVIRPNGKVIVAQVRGDLIDGGPAPYVSKVLRQGNMSGKRRRADQVGLGDRLRDEVGAVETVEDLTDGRIRLIWTGSDGTDVVQEFSPDDKIELDRSYPEQVERKPASAVLVHHPGGKFTLTWTGDWAANCGLTDCVARALRLADLKERFIVVHPYGERRYAVHVVDSEERQWVMSGLKRSGRFQGFKYEEDLRTWLVILKPRTVPELLVQTIDQIIRSQRSSGVRRRVIFLDGESQQQLEQRGLNDISVWGLNERNEWVRGQVDVFFLTQWGGLGNKFDSNPHAPATSLSPKRILQIVQLTIKDEKEDIAKKLMVPAPPVRPTGFSGAILPPPAVTTVEVRSSRPAMTDWPADGRQDAQDLLEKLLQQRQYDSCEPAELTAEELQGSDNGPIAEE